MMSRSTRSITSRPTSASFSWYDAFACSQIRSPISSDVRSEKSSSDRSIAKALPASRFRASRSHSSKSASLRRVGMFTSKSSVSSASDMRYSRVPTHLFVAFLVLELDLALEDLTPQRVDVLTLLVHHVVVLEQVLADGEVLRLHLLLRALDGLADHAVLDRHAFFHAQALHQAGDAIGSEDPHQIVFERQVEARRTRDRPGGRRGRGAGCRCGAPRGVRSRECADRSPRRPRRARRRVCGLEVLVDAVVVGLRDAVERVEVVEVDELLVFDEALFALREPLRNLFGQALLPRHELGVAAEQDVGAAAGHVGRDRDRALPAGLRDELGLLRVVLGVQHDVLVGAAAGRRASLEAAPVEHRRQPLRLLDRHGADENRTSFLVLRRRFP